jgi:hypothetical protein
MRRLAAIAVLFAGIGGHSHDCAAGEAAPDFQQRILPLLKHRCVPCHGPAVQEGKLNLAIPPGIARGGESGAVVIAGKPNESLLWKRVEADEMPEDEPLPAEEKELLKKWIAGGAKGVPEKVSAEPEGDEHWAFQKLHAVTLPKVKESGHLRTPIDHFVQARLEDAGLKMSPEADRYTLIRRVALDVTGLPPTPKEIEQFVNDTREGAYERMVDRYLDSPRYGERWGKYWLDAAGYADSNGYFSADTDRPLAFRYRDYVVRSINADKPFDQFITEQLAGDELVGYVAGQGITPEMIEPLEATHFLRNSPDGTDSSDGNADERLADKYAVLEGTMQIMGASLLGITVQCAKCHDHKFEPFSQRDFYQLQAVLYPAFDPDKWVLPKDREIMAASSAEIAAWKAKAATIDAEIADRRESFSSWMRENRERGRVLFEDSFDAPGEKLATSWSNSAPGDESAAGQPAVNIDSKNAPGALIDDGSLLIVESRDDGHRSFSTKQSFDWTPDTKGAWIQVTFDLMPGEFTAPYVGYYLALRDFNDERGMTGGNVLIDGARAGKAAVYVDYPGSDIDSRGEIGTSGYTPGRKYGVRITNVGTNQFELAQIVDGVLETGTANLSAADLPDGGFGFEYCCGRSFAIDNLVVEASDVAIENNEEQRKLADLRKKKRKQFEADLKTLTAQKDNKPGRLALVSNISPKMPNVYLLDRGDYKSPKEEVQPLPPGVLTDEEMAIGATLRNGKTKSSSGHRLAFARWLTKADSRASALLARITVNRWWHNHFGTGIVPTVENLGYSGASPSNPELLEHLATELIRSGWKQKEIHRMILNSAVYRQKSDASVAQLAADADNRWFGRFPLRRLDAEAIRDSMLSASGELDLTMGGPYVSTKRNADGDVVVDESVDGAHRRSIYLQQRRTQVVGFLDAFDAPSIVFGCTARIPTTVPIQSLKLLNSPFVRERSIALSKRILKSTDNNDDRIQSAFLSTFCRTPTEQESKLARMFLQRQPQNYSGQNDAVEQSWVDFCQMLLSSNTFLYLN